MTRGFTGSPDLVEDPDPGTAARPEGQRWHDRHAELKAKAAERQAARRASVRSRLRKDGISAAALRESLLKLGDEWTTGVLEVLADLAERGEAHQRDGLWFPGRSDGSVAPSQALTASVQVDPRERILAALGDRAMARMSLAVAAGLALADGLQTIERLIVEGAIAPEIGGRVKRVPKGDLARGPGGAPPVPSVQSPSGSVGPPRPVGGERASSPDPGAPAGRELVAAEREDGPAAGISDTADPGAGPVQPAAAPDGDPASEPDRANGQDGAAAPAVPPPQDPVPAGASGPAPATERLQRIADLVRAEPGMTTLEVAQRLGIADGGMTTTLRYLGLVGVRRTREDQARGPLGFRWYPPADGAAVPPPAPGTRDRLLAMVTAEPGMETRAIATRLGISSSRVGQVAHELGLRRELERDPARADGRGVTLARWYPSTPEEPGARPAEASREPLIPDPSGAALLPESSDEEPGPAAPAGELTTSAAATAPADTVDEVPVGAPTPSAGEATGVEIAPSDVEARAYGLHIVPPTAPPDRASSRSVEAGAVGLGPDWAALVRYQIELNDRLRAEVAELRRMLAETEARVERVQHLDEFVELVDRVLDVRGVALGWPRKVRLGLLLAQGGGE